MSRGERAGLEIGSKKSSLRQIFLRAFNKNQQLILLEVGRNLSLTSTSLLVEISKKDKTPLSTLKLNTKILKDLNLIKSDFSEPIKLTDTGRFVLGVLAQSGVIGSTASCKSIKKQNLASSGSNPDIGTSGGIS